MDEQKAIARVKREYTYRNSYNKEHYDRLTALLPKGTKERIKATGESANGMIVRLILAELERQGV